MPNLMQRVSVRRIKTMVNSIPHYQESCLQSQLRDMLTDLRHYAEVNALEFYKALDGSYEVYLRERSDES